MLSLIIVNCDDKYIEYEWELIEDFIKDMESDNENIPMLDDVLAEVNTQDEDVQNWWEGGDVLSVYELFEMCKTKRKEMI